MAVSQQVFWSQVKHERLKLATALEMGKYPGQPKYNEDLVLTDPERPNFRSDDNVMFITSLSHNDRGTRAGFTVEATVQMAGQKIVEQTHAVSTQAEIEKYKSHQESQRAFITTENATRKLREMHATLGITANDILEAQTAPSK
jgi:ribosomal protein L15E